MYAPKNPLNCVLESGITRPSHNEKLAKLIEEAKRANMPVASINTFLEKMEARKNKTLTGIIEVRGPNGYVVLVRYTTDNVKAFIMQLNSKLKKTRYENYYIYFLYIIYIFKMS